VCAPLLCISPLHQEKTLQRRLEEIGGIKPLALLVVGQFGEMWGPAPKRSLLAWRNEGQMRWRIADRYLIENREAAVGVHMFHMRQRWGLWCGGRKRRSSLVG
jgi:hypothetical protein